jgi:glycosyltransferase involved in cell wall biosynthesis
MSFQYTFTVFTPTYNRAHTLHRVYESLQRQTCHDFEWLIVDDGSTDATREVVGQWQQQAKFPISYIYQENQGKHVAFNRGVSEARGEFFLTLDSDDSCVPEALGRFKYHWDAIPANLRDRFAAVTALCKDQDGRLVGDKFPRDLMDSDPLEMRYKFKVRGEKWGFTRTEILKQFPYPIIDATSYVPESIVWNAIARRFKTRFVNELLRVYYFDTSERSDQLTTSADPAKHAFGLALWHQSVLNDEIGWFRYAPGQFLRSAAHYARFSLHTKVNLFYQIKKLENVRAKALYILMLPAGLALFLRDRV